MGIATARSLRSSAALVLVGALVSFAVAGCDPVRCDPERGEETCPSALPHCVPDGIGYGYCSDVPPAEPVPHDAGARDAGEADAGRIGDGGHGTEEDAGLPTDAGPDDAPDAGEAPDDDAGCIDDCDDGWRLVFLADPATAAVGATLSPPVEVAIEDDLGNVVEGAVLVVTLELGENPSDALLYGTLEIDAVLGLAAFDDLSLDGAGEGFTLVATAEGLAPVESAPFDVIEPTVPTAPAGLSASSDSPDVVALAWSPSPGATSYAVYRDGVLVGEVDTTSFDDGGAAGGGMPGAPVALTASAGSYTDRVAVGWSAATTSAGAEHQYLVRAKNAAGSSGDSVVVTGKRAAYPVTGYEISLDGGESWFNVGLVTSWDDDTAPAGTAQAGVASASEGSSASYVALALTGQAASPGEQRSYVVRAVSTAGSGPSSSPSGGYRGVGALTFQWQRSSGDADNGYVNLVGATAVDHVDTTAPPDGSGRYYRCVVGAAGAAPVTSTPGRGYRNTVGTEVVTLSPGTVSTTSIQAGGQLDALGVPAPTAHGLCIGPFVNPALGGQDVTCTTLGAPTGTGAFSSTFNGLTAGTQYHVRAYASDASSGTIYGADVAVWTLPEAPTDVSASQGTSSAHVTLSFSPSVGALEYHIYRDGALAATTTSSSTHDDTGATAGGLPAAPASVAAGDGTSTSRVTVTWSAPSSPDGPVHSYVVRASNASGEGPASTGVEGYRAAYPLLDYEVSVDGGATWQSVGLVTTWDDTDAPPASINPGAAAASDGTFESHVALSLGGASTSAATSRSYKARARNAAGTGGASIADDGYRGVGSLTYQWQRSSSDADASYGALAGATAALYDDDTAPNDGAGRWYRCVVSAAGAAPATSTADRGHLQIELPQVTTLTPLTVTATSLEARGSVDVVGVPDATGHGLCLATTADPSLGGAGVTCNSLGAPTEGAVFSSTFSGLDAGVEYHVRAYATHPTLGTRYGTDVAVPTVPDAPTSVAASDGSYTGYVRITFSAATGATQYDVYRNGVLAGSTANTYYNDTGATAGGVPGTPTGVAATDGAHTDKVAVTWTAPTTPDGPSHTYVVRASNASGESASSTSDAGYRGDYAVSGYEVSVDNGSSWQSVGNVTSWDDTDAAAGTVNAGTASASDGAYIGYVRLTLSGVSASAGAARTYRVRAKSTAGTGSQSSSNTGYRGVGSLTYLWSRTDTDSSTATYKPLPGASTAAYDDAGAPADGSGRWYRCTVGAAGATSATTAGNRGYRLGT